MRRGSEANDTKVAKAQERPAAGDGLETLFEAFRQECAAPPAAPGFLAGFRGRRDAWLERSVPLGTAAAWRLLALRLAPAGGLMAAAAITLTLGVYSPGIDASPEVDPDDPALAAYEDPLEAGLEQAGVATVAMNGEDPGYDLLAVLYEPLETP